MLIISTFNIKNNYNKYQKIKATDIYKYVLNNNIDVLCIQEVFSKCRNDLEKNIEESKYKLYGKYRYRLRIFRPISEAVSVLTRKEVLKNDTFHLPFLPSLLKRIVTRVEIKTDEFGKIVIYNTHLDYKFDIVKKRQLKKLLKYIRKEHNPIIVTGDFNLKNNNDLFLIFIKEMNDIGLKRVEVNDKTLKQSRGKRAIDHIFISKEFKLKKFEVVKDLSISDHYPILVQLEKKD